ncbi:ATP-dependent DNA helicase RecG [Nesterenkonia ebinurensis]|uniref:ATP-dependent DNA helicase RecG n=1 Tax=Nesterenkonia ebinurensis TaxID=2608252 RepID=UPI00168BEF9E|nr:ATP-dependent DNA helicase RecG [Nesterenkonia ebinurensis]
MIQPVQPQTPLPQLLAPQAAQALHKAFGHTTAKDLLDHFPREHLPHNALSSFAGLREGELASFVAKVERVSSRRLQTRRGQVVDVAVADQTGQEMTMGFFGGFQATRQLRTGTLAMFHGKVRLFQNRPTLTNPKYEVLGRQEDGPADSSQLAGPELEQDKIIAVYPASAMLTSGQIRDCVRTVLDQTDLSLWPDAVPPQIAQAEQLPSLAEAYRMMHRPDTMDEPEAAWYRFRMEEALLLQGLMERRRRLAGQLPGIAAPQQAGGRLEALDAQLPFQLTEGQRECGQLLAAELERETPMNRLLQGEVGSGKTLVALRAMLQVIDAGAQAALVAPTEVLALQHERSLRRMLGALADDSVRMTLLTGSMSAAERKQALLDIASGRTDLVIGTHAVLGEKVHFAQLGLTVIDEQHRFGVAQRNALRQRSRPAPHMLVMSATPIPRSVAMTLFGDLELTVLRGLPGGRSPIKTVVVPELRKSWRERVWEKIAEEAEAGRQVYVVCPKISALERTKAQIQSQLAERFGFEDGQDSVRIPAPAAEGEVIYVDFSRKEAVEHITNDASVERIEQKFAEHPQLRRLRCGSLHGQMPAEAAREVMQGFESGEIRVLIATTVIEVGVDVPNATLMVVLDADAFGVSTLHQLRGRIGRGSTQDNLCLLVTRMPEGHPSLQRLNEVAKHTDGLRLAELDLARRREGNVLGAEQSGGASVLRRLRIVTDAEIIAAAGEHIGELTRRDPEWATAPMLWRAVEQWRLEHDEAEKYIHQG